MLGSPVIDVSLKDSLLVYVLKFFGISAGRCGSIVVWERDSIPKVRVRPWVAIFFIFSANALNNRSKIL